MDSAEIVVHEMESDSSLMIFQPLRERVGQTSKAAHGHSHGQVLSLCIASGNMFCVWSARDYYRLAANTLRWTVFGFRFSVASVKFDQHCVINFCAKGGFHGI